jgi:hypothetical protein
MVTAMMFAVVFVFFFLSMPLRGAVSMRISINGK